VSLPCPVGKIAEKAVCRSIFDEFYKNALPRTVFLAILPTGCNDLLLNSYRQRSIAVERHTYFQLPIINHTYQIIQANAHT